MQKSVLGYGSIFHKEDITRLPEISDTSFLGNHTLFYAGRYAIKYIIDCILKERDIATLWMPNYYCPYVKNWLEEKRSSIKYYDIDPFDANAQINWKQFDASDVVLTNNYWGIKANPIPSGTRPLIIEDHSHGWLSEGCVQSKADFCIASLRKTLPIPLSGIAWKPKNGNCTIPLLPINGAAVDHNTDPMTRSWNLMDDAMTKKANCSDPKEKSEFLSSYSQGEMLLRNTQEIFEVQNIHKELIRKALFKDYNSFKKQNLEYIHQNLAPSTAYKLLYLEHPVPFGLLLVFKDKETMASCKHYLIDNAIYPAELWPKNTIAQKYKHLLNLHVDFRYTTDDMRYLVAVINRWSSENHDTDMQKTSEISEKLAP
ncbi:hypothetical protein ACFQZJ_18940 [Maribacter chungangensis]|uniref:DegT/DnrJ/EryC1/StrS aminotransferase family protein n=1 Tax=Maribacter chungangensis TaxID=1069117 RepID=A0ABW3B919_9FLAO